MASSSSRSLRLIPHTSLLWLLSVLLFGPCLSAHVQCRYLSLCRCWKYTLFPSAPCLSYLLSHLLFCPLRKPSHLCPFSLPISFICWPTFPLHKQGDPLASSLLLSFLVFLAPPVKCWPNFSITYPPKLLPGSVSDLAPGPLAALALLCTVL